MTDHEGDAHPVVRYEARGRVGIVTLARPEARNAVNGEVATAIESHFDQLEADPEIWAAIVTGDGGVFCAGADLKSIARTGGRDAFTKRGGFAGLARRERTKPLIAAVEGHALAGGCEIVLACDLVVASRRATFGLPEVKRSLVAAGGAMFRLPQRIPSVVAMELLLTGDSIDAQRAFDLGLINRVVEPGDALAAALQLAERINENAPLAVRTTRAVALAAQHTSEEEGWRLSRDALRAVAQTDDYREGPRAFVEKRAPVWTGR
ncbi:MAG TPA: crotonase/enoyl-CoA hydratase family protein [Acidimicrobiales bacterium]|nr:crotonase/enoyl-CoA hydratase family protein [Acidimicrobiales bacterium]